MVLLAVFCGLRRAEIGGLQWRDIRESHVLIRRSVVRGRQGPAKTEGSETSVPIGPKVQEALGAWQKRTRFSGGEDYVFALRTATPCNLDRVATKVLKPTARKIGIEPLCWHDLRHSFCTLGRHEGIAPEVMQRLMRQTDIRTTLEIYSHVTEHGAAERIEGSTVLPASCYSESEVQFIQ
jgi:integrase